MKFNKTHRIISLLMAMLVLVSSTGFSVDLHFCQGEVKSFSLLGKAPSCHEKLDKKHCNKQQKSCHTAPANQDDLKHCKKDCCSNQTIKVEHNDEAKKLQTIELSQKQIKFISAFIQGFLLEKTDLSKAIVPHLNYVPPLLSKDIPVLVQSFLL